MVGVGAHKARWRQALGGKQKVCNRKQEVKPQRNTVIHSEGKCPCL